MGGKLVLLLPETYTYLSISQELGYLQGQEQGNKRLRLRRRSGLATIITLEEGEERKKKKYQRRSYGGGVGAWKQSSPVRHLRLALFLSD